MSNIQSSLVTLNHKALKRKIENAGVSFAWLAESLGVNRHTIMRWTNGKVKQIRNANLNSLSNVLNCSPEELRDRTSVRNLGSSSDQTLAASLLIDSDTFATMRKAKQTLVLEKMIRAVCLPSLSVATRGELLHTLAKCLLIRDRLVEARKFCEEAYSCLQNISGQETNLVKVAMTAAHILYMSGDFVAMRIYADFLVDRQHLFPELKYKIVGLRMKLLFSEGNYKDALSLFNSVEETLHENVLPEDQGYLTATAAYAALGVENLSLARVYAEKAYHLLREEKPDLAFHLIVTLAETCARAGDIERYEYFIDKAIEEHRLHKFPLSVIQIAQARAAIFENKYEEAIEFCNAAIQEKSTVLIIRMEAIFVMLNPLKMLNKTDLLLENIKKMYTFCLEQKSEGHIQELRDLYPQEMLTLGLT